MSVYSINGTRIDGVNSYSFLNGKSYFALGDSITMNSGTKAAPVTVSGETLYGYTQAIEDKYGLICTNKGQSGHTLVQDFSMLNGLNYSAVSLVTIGYGTNDVRLDVPLGTVGSADTTTYAGALGTLIKKINTDNKYCRILALTPIQRALVHGFDSYTDNNNGDNLEDFAEMCKAVANHYGIECVDLFHNSGLNESNLMTLTFEGVHPKNKGYNRMINCIMPHTDGLFGFSTNFE